MKNEFGDAVKGIQLTEAAHQPPKNIDFVSAEERVKALHDPVRLQILRMLRDGIEDYVTTEVTDELKGVKTITKRSIRRHALSVTELINLSKDSEIYDPISKNQIYHHLPKLIENGFIIEYGTVEKGKRKTKYYRRTADNFVTFGLHYGPRKFKEALYKEMKTAMPVFKLEMNESERESLIKKLVEAESLRLKWANIIEDIVQGDITDPKAIELFEWFIWLYATGQDEFNTALKELREMLFPDH